MLKRNKLILAILVPAILVAITFAGYLLVFGSRTYTLKGTITRLDVAGDRVSFEYINPRKGKLREFTGHIPTNCDIQLNGRPARLGDLKAGDNATVLARWDRRQNEVQPLAIKVERKSGTTTQPVTTAKSEPGKP